jgi:WD40 repeat protein
MYHKLAIERFPLQTYMSALLFSPKQSIIKNLYAYEELKEKTIVWPVEDQWSACLQTLEGHSSVVNSVAFSHDSTWLASASRDGTVMIWNTSSGACLQILDGDSSEVNSVVFSHDSTRLAGALGCTIKIWDTSSGACLQILEGHSNVVCSVVFSHDSTRLASGSVDGTAKIWNTSSGACLQTREDPGADMPEDFQQPRFFPYRSIGISQNRSWVTWKSQKVLWLPTEYRPFCHSVSRKMAGMGTGSGKVWMCRFKAAD